MQGAGSDGIRAGAAIRDSGHEGPGGALVEQWFGQHRL